MFQKECSYNYYELYYFKAHFTHYLVTIHAIHDHLKQTYTQCECSEVTTDSSWRLDLVKKISYPFKILHR